MVVRITYLFLYAVDSERKNVPQKPMPMHRIQNTFQTVKCVIYNNSSENKLGYCVLVKKETQAKKRTEVLSSSYQLAGGNTIVQKQSKNDCRQQ